MKISKILDKYKKMIPTKELIGDYTQNRVVLYNLDNFVLYNLLLYFLLVNDKQPNNGNVYTGLRFLFSKNSYINNGVIYNYLKNNNFISQIFTNEESDYDNLIGINAFIFCDYQKYNNNTIMNFTDIEQMVRSICERGIKVYYLMPINAYEYKDYPITENDLVSSQSQQKNIIELSYIDHTMQYLKKKYSYPIYRVITPVVDQTRNVMNSLYTYFNNEMERTGIPQDIKVKPMIIKKEWNKAEQDNFFTKYDIMAHEKFAEALYHLIEELEPKNYLIGVKEKISYYDTLTPFVKINNIEPKIIITNTEFIDKYNIENFPLKWYTESTKVKRKDIMNINFDKYKDRIEYL